MRFSPIVVMTVLSFCASSCGGKSDASRTTSNTDGHLIEIDAAPGEGGGSSSSDTSSTAYDPEAGLAESDDICTGELDSAYSGSPNEPAFLCTFTSPAGTTFNERSPYASAFAKQAIRVEFCEGKKGMTRAEFDARVACKSDGLYGDGSLRK